MKILLDISENINAHLHVFDYVHFSMFVPFNICDSIYYHSFFFEDQSPFSSSQQKIFGYTKLQGLSRMCQNLVEQLYYNFVTNLRRFYHAYMNIHSPVKLFHRL